MNKRLILAIIVSILLAGITMGVASADVKREIYDYQGSHLRYKINYSLFDAINFTGTRMTLTGNVTADYFFGNFSGEFSGNSSIWSRAGTNTFLTNVGDKVGIGTTTPQRKLHVNGGILSNATINATGDICIEGGNCLSNVIGVGEETDPFWSANYTAYNDSWSSTYNSTYNTWAYNQTIPAINTILGWSYYNSTDFDYNDYLLSADWNATNESYYLKSNPFGFWNDTYATFNETYADTLYSTIDEPLWTANYSAYNDSWSSTYNASYVPYTGATQNVDLGDNNFTVNATTLHVDVNTGRVGIGTATPGARLHVDGDEAYNSATPNFMVDDDAGRIMGIWGSHISRLEGDADNINLGFNYLGYNGGTTRFRDVAFYDGKTNIIMYVDGSAGSLGIGTASPAEELEVEKSQDQITRILVDNPHATGTTALASFEADASTAKTELISHGAARTVTRYGITVANWSEVISTAGEGLLIGTYTNDNPIIFGSNNLERMRIDAGGNVGIGTTTPLNRISLGNADYIGWRNAIDSGETVGIRSTAADDLQFYVAGVRMTILSDGKVGILDSTPSYTLDVNGQIRGTDYYSGDGTQGMTQAINCGVDTWIRGITIKDGLVTAVTCAAL